MEEARQLIEELLRSVGKEYMIVDEVKISRIGNKRLAFAGLDGNAIVPVSRAVLEARWVEEFEAFHFTTPGSLYSILKDGKVRPAGGRLPGHPEYQDCTPQCVCWASKR
jgi:hypothetical protein